MKFSDPTNKSGIVDKIRFLTKTTTSTYHINDITREINNALDDYFVIAMNASNLWQIDDISYTNYALATTNLVSGQRDYQMPAGLVDIDRVYILNESNDWQTLTPIDQSQYSGDLEQIYDESALPLFYEKKADGIFLFPASNYNKTAGLKIEYRRIANYFITTDTDKQAGIPYFHHEYLVFPPVFNYNIKEGKAIKNDFVALKQSMEDKIKRYWSKRGKDMPVRIVPAYNSPL
jgi:hypothetical protein